MRINESVAANRYVQDIHKNQEESKKSAEKLSSGSRINRASDDPAGLIISEKVRSQIASLEQEFENISREYNKLSAADSNLADIQESLSRMRDLASAAANSGGNSQETIATYQNALVQEQKNQEQLIENSSYGNQALLDGSCRSVGKITPLSGLDVSTPEKAQEALSAIDRRIKEISEIRGKIGSTQKNDLEARQNSLSVQISNLTSVESEIRDVDMAGEYTRFVGKEIALKAGIALAAQPKPDIYQAIQLLK
jgi:flagellin